MDEVDAVVDAHSQDHRRCEGVDEVHPDVEGLHQAEHPDDADRQLEDPVDRQAEAAEVESEKRGHEDHTEDEGDLRIGAEEPLHLGRDHAHPGDLDLRVAPLQRARKALCRCFLRAAGHREDEGRRPHLAMHTLQVAADQLAQLPLLQILDRQGPAWIEQVRKFADVVLEGPLAEPLGRKGLSEDPPDPVHGERTALSLLDAADHGILRRFVRQVVQHRLEARDLARGDPRPQARDDPAVAFERLLHARAVADGDHVVEASAETLRDLLLNQDPFVVRRAQVAVGVR